MISLLPVRHLSFVLDLLSYALSIWLPPLYQTEVANSK
jgi:hypothetical protein